MDDLLPRADISGIIAGAVAALGSADWKERKAALDEIEAAVAGAGGRIQPSVSAWRGAVARARRGLNRRSARLGQRLKRVLLELCPRPRLIMRTREPRSQRARQPHPPCAHTRAAPRAPLRLPHASKGSPLFPATPQVGDLFPGLKGRMADSNRNLATQVGCT